MRPSSNSLALGRERGILALQPTVLAGIAWLPHEFAYAFASVLETHEIHNRLAMVTDAMVYDALAPLARASEYVVTCLGDESGGFGSSLSSTYHTACICGHGWVFCLSIRRVDMPGKTRQIFP